MKNNSVILFLFLTAIISYNSPAFLWYPEWQKGMNVGSQDYNKKFSNQTRLQKLNTLEALYHKNNPANLTYAETPRIPKIYHRIWVGKRPVPPLFKKLEETWIEKLPGWKYMCWTNKEAEQLFPLFSEEHLAIYNNGNKDEREKADILRLYILKYYGGVYIDGDFEPLAPEAFNEIIHYYDFFIGISGNRNGELINNAIMGCGPENPIINHLLSSLKNTHPKDWRHRSGVFFFSNTFMQFIKDAPGINITFPSTVFYALPFGTHVAIEHYLKPWSLAIHYWAQTQNHNWKK